MTKPKLPWSPRISMLLGAILGTLMLVVMMITAAETNSLTFSDPGTDAAHLIPPVSPNDMLPQACIDNGVSSVAQVISGDSGSTLTGANDGDLLLASSTTATIQGGTGNDCIVVGSSPASSSGTGTVDGGSGTNVCVLTPSATVVPTNCLVVRS